MSRRARVLARSVYAVTVICNEVYGGEKMKRFDIERTFRTDDDKRDNFLSRLFGIFNEDIVRLWCKNHNSKYTDEGRPSLYEGGKYTETTLDFGLRDQNGDIFLGEQKCELGYRDYKFIELNSVDQLDHHKSKKAFRRFLEVAKSPDSYTVKIDRKEVSVKGSILIWGHVNEKKKNDIKKYYKFHDILSIENMVNDLLKWKDKEYIDYINTRCQWMNELMSNLS